jgi:DNA-binding response OmpR family regulator
LELYQRWGMEIVASIVRQGFRTGPHARTRARERVRKPAEGAEVVADGRTLPIAAEKPRALLAILLLRPNEIVSVDRLVDELWGDDPPASAHHLTTVTRSV